jgi:hypothetical protein
MLRQHPTTERLDDPMARDIRCYDYVNPPYEMVSEALGGDGRVLLRVAQASVRRSVNDAVGQLRSELSES